LGPSRRDWKKQDGPASDYAAEEKSV